MQHCYTKQKYVLSQHQIVYLIYLALSKYLIQSNRFDNCDKASTERQRNRMAKSEERNRERETENEQNTQYPERK